jgi:hypothetical protein
MAEEVREKLNRGCVDPMDVVEGQNEWLVFAQTRQESSDGPEGPVALGLWSWPLDISEGGESREYRSKLGESLAPEEFEPSGLEQGEIVSERIHQDAERELALELGGPPTQDKVTVPCSSLT